MPSKVFSPWSGWPVTGSLFLELVIFDRGVRVRSENSVNLTGIDTQSPKGWLNRPDLVIAELEIVPAWRLGHLDETILIQPASEPLINLTNNLSGKNMVSGTLKG
jgi:hypothetical protein